MRAQGEEAVVPQARSPTRERWWLEQMDVPDNEQIDNIS